MFSNKSKGTKQKRTIDLKLNILYCPFVSLCFHFHGNACLQRNALACIYESSEEGKKADWKR